MMNISSLNDHQKSYRVFFSVLVIILAGIYFLNFFTSLRLTHDTVRYFRAEEWMASGFPSDSAAASDFLPYGYSGLLWLLSRLHLLHPFVLAFINSLYLFGAIWFVTKIFLGTIRFRQLAFYTMLSWLALKFVITPLSEMQYLFFSTGALYFYRSYRLHCVARDLLSAFAFFIAAILTRTAGIAVLLAVIFSLLIENRRQMSMRLRKNKKWIVGMIAGSAILVYFLSELKITEYFNFFFTPISRYGVGVFIRGIPLHLRDWSEMFVNTPSSKIKFLPATIRDILFISAGIFFLTVLFYFLFNKKSNAPSIIKYYLLVYVIIVMSWPYFDSRFWFPIFPFILAIFLQRVGSAKISKPLLIVVKAGYIIMGIFALGYYTFTSFNKETLARKQDAGLWRNEYEIHFFGRALSDTARQQKPEVIRILDRVDKPLINF